MKNISPSKFIEDMGKQCRTSLGSFNQSVSEHPQTKDYPYAKCSTNRFLTPKDISAARFEIEKQNSARKRGNLKRGTKDLVVVCGCGVEGCIFTSTVKY